MAKKNGLKCPPHLEGEAAKEWQRLMRSPHAFTSADRASLAAYCSAWATYTKAEAELNASSLTRTTIHGNIIPAPVLGVRNTAAKLLVRIANELGLTPRSRRNVVPAEPAANPFDEDGD